MKKPSTSKGTKQKINGGFINSNYSDHIDWELRPGGMLVQKRDIYKEHDPSAGPLIKIKVSHGSCYYDVSIPSQSTFGDMKMALEQEFGLQPKEQRLLFGGKERDDGEYLHMVGVKDMSKVVLLEDPATKERKLEQMNQANLKAFEQLAIVKAEVDKLLDKVAALSKALSNGIKITDTEFVVLTELLMLQLLKLDAIEANSEAKVQRRAEVRRVQSLVDTLDNLKVRNSNPSTTNNSDVV